MDNDGYGNSPGRRIDFFPNLGYRQPTNPPPFASTPAITRAPRPRFAYTGPPNYPRPGSSASKPNPSSFSELMRSRYIPTGLSDSMLNNYGDSMSNMDDSYLQDKSFASEYSSHNDSMDSSVYYSCNDTFSSSPKKNFPLLDPPYMQQAGPGRSGSFQSTPFSSKKKQFKATSAARFNKKPKPYAKPQPPGNKSDWRCELCNIDFTSRVPFAMHFQGQKHAKKLKLKEALKSIQSQVKEKEVVTIGSLFRCDVCGTVANSSSQLQTHLDGLKHKAKVAQLAIEEEEKNNPKEKSDCEETNKPDAIPGEKSGNPKQNGSKKKKVPKEKTAPISVLPTNVSSVEMQIPPAPPLAAQSVFTCVICDITLNSEHQHQQHMLGKYHKAKAEGKPVPWKKNKPKKNLVQKYKEKLKKAAEGKTETLAAEKGIATEQMETTGAPEVENPNKPVANCKQMEQIEERAVETPAIEKPVVEVANPKNQSTNITKPLVGILKKKNPCSERVMGVKSLESTFVKGDELK